MRLRETTKGNKMKQSELKTLLAPMCEKSAKFINDNSGIYKGYTGINALQLHVVDNNKFPEMDNGIWGDIINNSMTLLNEKSIAVDNAMQESIDLHYNA